MVRGSQDGFTKEYSNKARNERDDDDDEQDDDDGCAGGACKI